MLVFNRVAGNFIKHLLFQESIHKSRCLTEHIPVTIDARGGSRTAETSKVELFVIIVNGWKPLTIIIKSSPLGVAAVLDPPLDAPYILLRKKCSDCEYFFGPYIPAFSPYTGKKGSEGKFESNHFSRSACVCAARLARLFTCSCS